jgi:hypothetical protein
MEHTKVEEAHSSLLQYPMIMVPFIEKHIALIKHKIEGARSNGLFKSRSVDLKSRYYVKEGGLHDLEKKDRMIVSLHPWV